MRNLQWEARARASRCRLRIWSSGKNERTQSRAAAARARATEGSFLLRAESLKLNPSQLTASQTQLAVQQTPAAQAKAKSSQPSQSSQAGVQSVIVILSDKGYQPDTFKLRQGIPARVTFVRKVEATCGTEIVLADYNIKRELPLNQPVVVDFSPPTTSEIKFACGMDMPRSKIIVQ